MFYNLQDLPPLEELTITVDESVVMVEVGSIKSIVGILGIYNDVSQIVLPLLSVRLVVHPSALSLSTLRRSNYWWDFNQPLQE
jgi:hypothetical protein